MAALLSRADELHGRGINLFIISILFGLAAAGTVILRVISRGNIGKKLGPDDHVIILSMIFSIALSICNCISVVHGNGKKQSTLPIGDIHVALQAFWVAQIVYKFTINLTKTSICLLYLRIFTHVKWFRTAVYAVIVFVLLYAVASIIATIVQCTPIARVWDHSIAGSCINLTRFWYANAAANIFSDFVILTLPMPVVRRLQLPVRQRWGLALVFGIGGFVCVTSVLRMITLDTSSKSPDVTYGNLTSTVWTAVEANTGIICACLPMLKAPLAALFPKLFPRGTYGDYSNGSGTSTRRPWGPSLPHNAPPTAFDGWGRYIEKKPSQTSTRTSGNTVIGNPPLGKCSRNDSSNGEYGMNGNDVPLGQIAKTTHVNVQFNDKGCYSPNDNYHSRSLSNLVSPGIGSA